MSVYVLQVEEIQLLNTTLRRFNGDSVLVPNQKLYNDGVTNLSRSPRKGEGLTVRKGSWLPGYLEGR
jgi:small-conductance mechanosensitive channel